MRLRIVWWLVALLILVASVLLGLEVDTYNGVNKGFTVGHLGGCEIVGTPGCWFGDVN